MGLTFRPPTGNVEQRVDGCRCVCSVGGGQGGAQSGWWMRCFGSVSPTCSGRSKEPSQAQRQSKTSVRGCEEHVVCGDGANGCRAGGGGGGRGRRRSSEWSGKFVTSRTDTRTFPSKQRHRPPRNNNPPLIDPTPGRKDRLITHKEACTSNLDIHGSTRR